MIKDISDNGITLIEKYEGLKLKAYKCPAGIWTIGIGSTIFKGKSVKQGDTCTKQEAYDEFRIHLKKYVYPTIYKVKVALNQQQFDALSSFIYNIGETSFNNSTLLKLLNTGNYTGAAEQFCKWNKAGGKVLAGLTTRRESEKQLFLS